MVLTPYRFFFYKVPRPSRHPLSKGAEKYMNRSFEEKEPKPLAFQHEFDAVALDFHLRFNMNLMLLDLLLRFDMNLMLRGVIFS